MDREITEAELDIFQSAASSNSANEYMESLPVGRQRQSLSDLFF